MLEKRNKKMIRIHYISLRRQLNSILPILLLAGVFLCSCGFSSSSKNDSASTIYRELKEAAIPLNDRDDLDTLIEKAKQKRIVMLGESTHGTSEFYEWRFKISKRLIKEAGFNFIVVEGDWHPFCLVNRHVKGIEDKCSDSRELLKTNFSRWPPWMWANSTTVRMVDWLKEYNSKQPVEFMSGLYGMDVYGHWRAMDSVKAYIEKKGIGDDSENIYACFESYRENEWGYARHVLSGGESCEKEVNEALSFLKKNRDNLLEKSAYDYFSAEQNALVVKNAELYYRTAGLGGALGWNNRVLHMYETLQRLLAFYGDDSKAIVWAHNTHVGDASATSMAARGQLNIGQLARRDFGTEEVYIIGFGTHRGKVKAGKNWGEKGEVMEIPAAREQSAEDIFNTLPFPSFLLHFDGITSDFLQRALLHRAIGVVYNPDNETGNYVPSVLPRRYDSFIFIDDTNPVSFLMN